MSLFEHSAVLTVVSSQRELQSGNHVECLHTSVESAALHRNGRVAGVSVLVPVSSNAESSFSCDDAGFARAGFLHIPPSCSFDQRHCAGEKMVAS